MGRVTDADNTTVRWLYGVTLNNNPTVLSGYRTADGVFSWLRAGQETHTPARVHRLAGTSPYWRLAWNHE